MNDIERGRDELLAQLHALVDQPLEDAERRAVVAGLLFEELDDVVLGRRHLTIVHGWLAPADELRWLNPMLDWISAQLGARCVRIVAGPFHCTLTVAGPEADATVESLIGMLSPTVPASWRLIASARPA